MIRPGAARGFTLLEMLVVIAVMGLVGLVVFGNLPPRSARAQVRAAAALVTGGLRTARGEAIARDRPVAVSLDPAAPALRVGSATPLSLGRVAMASPRAITFAPDGSSSGGRIELASGPVSLRLDVSWLTGRVTTTEAP